MTQTQVLNDPKRVEATLKALEKAQTALAGVAERAGIYSEEDVVRLCKEVRRELYEERYARHG